MQVLARLIRMLVLIQVYLLSGLVLRCGRNKICSAAARLGVPGVNSPQAADAFITAKAEEFTAKPSVSQQLFAAAAPLKRQAIVSTFQELLQQEGIDCQNLEHGLPKGSTSEGLATLYGFDELAKEARKSKKLLATTTATATATTNTPNSDSAGQAGLLTKFANNRSTLATGAAQLDLDTPLAFGRFKGQTLRDLLNSADGQRYLRWLAGEGNVTNRGINYSEQARLALQWHSQPQPIPAPGSATSSSSPPPAPAPAPLPAFLDPSSPHYIHGGYNNANGNGEQAADRPPLDKNGYSWDGFKFDPATSVEYDRQGYDRDGFNKDGYNRMGFNRQGFDREGYNAAGYKMQRGISIKDPTAKIKANLDRNGYDTIGFDVDGYDASGYDKQGYDRNGYDKFGYNASGYDAKGYSRLGYASYKRDSEGYDPDGYDVNGYDRNGYNAEGYNKQGQLHPFFTSQDPATGLYADGYDDFGRDKDGYYLKDGLDKDGFDRQGYNTAGYDREGYNRDGLKMALDGVPRDRNGYDINGFNLAGLHPTGYNNFGFRLDTKRNVLGYDVEGYDAKGLDYWGYDRNGYNPATKRKRKIAPGSDGAYGFDNAGYNRWGFNHQGLTADNRNFCGWNVALEPDPADLANATTDANGNYIKKKRPRPVSSSAGAAEQMLIARNPQNPDEWMYHTSPGTLGAKPASAQELLKPRLEIKEDGYLAGGSSKRILDFAYGAHVNRDDKFRSPRIRTGTTPLNQPPLPSPSPHMAGKGESEGGRGSSAGDKAKATLTFDAARFDLHPDLKAYFEEFESLKKQRPTAASLDLALAAAAKVPALAGKVTGRQVGGSRLELVGGGRLVIPDLNRTTQIKNQYAAAVKEQSKRTALIEQDIRTFKDALNSIVSNSNTSPSSVSSPISRNRNAAAAAVAAIDSSSSGRDRSSSNLGFGTINFNVPGSKIQGGVCLIPQERWYKVSRAVYDRKATLKGIPARCPKCGRFIATNFVQGQFRHNCPAFGNISVVVTKTGLANKSAYSTIDEYIYGLANDMHCWVRSKKPDLTEVQASALSIGGNLTGTQTSAQTQTLAYIQQQEEEQEQEVYDYEQISFPIDRRAGLPPGGLAHPYSAQSTDDKKLAGFDYVGYDPFGRDKQGRDRAGRDKDGFDRNGYDREGYDRDGYHKRDGFDRNGYNREGDKRGLSTLEDFTAKFDGKIVTGDPINNEGIKQMLSKLCSALTGQPRKIVFREGGGFATDMKGTIYLEPYPLGKGKPIADNLAVVRGGLEHELGHELYTNVNHWRTVLDIAKAGADVDPADTEGLNEEGRQLVPHVYNIIEDGRMERQVARLAGAAEHLALSCKIEPRWDERVGEGVDPQHQVYGALLYTALPFFKVRDEVRAAMSPDARAIFEELEPLARKGVLGSQEDALAASLEITRRLQAHDFGKPPEELDIRPPADPPEGGNESGSESGSGNGQSGSGGGQGQGQGQGQEQGENSSNSGSGSGSPSGGNSGGAGSGSGSSSSKSNNNSNSGSGGGGGGSSGSDSTGAGTGAGGGTGTGTRTASQGTPGSSSGSSAGANRSSTGNAGGGSNNSQDENENEKGDTTGSGSGSGGGKVGAQFGNQNARKNGASSADANEETASSKDGAPNASASASAADTPNKPYPQTQGTTTAPSPSPSSASGSDDGAEAGNEGEDKDTGTGTGSGGKDNNDDGSNNDTNAKPATKDKDSEPPSFSSSSPSYSEREEGVQTPDELTDWGDLISDKALEDAYRSLDREASRYVGLEVRAQARVENFGRTLHRPLGVRTTHDTEEQVYLDGDGLPQKASVSFPKAGRLKFQSRRAQHIQHGNALAKELRNIREQTEKTVSMQSRGRLDRGRFVQAVKGQRDVYNQTQEATKTSFAVSISLDQSGSMQQTANSGALLDATMTLSHALEQLDMAYEVRGFNNGNYQYKAIDDTDFDPYRAEVLTNANGGTHMAATAGLAMTSLAARQEKNRLAIYMTDGMLNDHLESKQSLLQARKKGITTFGIYLGNPESLSEWDTKAKLDELYGDGNWVVVSSIEQMPRSVGHKIATMLRRIR
jgi:hypothetical protein